MMARWTAEHADALRCLNAAGFDDNQIASRLGFCVKTIRRKRHEMQLGSYYTVRYSNWGTLTSEARLAISMLAGIDTALRECGLRRE